jgi:hypothetical protein
MNIKIASLAFMAVAVTSGCASTTSEYAQETVQVTEAVQATDTLAAAEVTQAAETKDAIDALEVADRKAYDPNAIMCKRVTKTGTRFKTKICATNAEWRASEESATEATDKMQERPIYGKPTS